MTAGYQPGPRWVAPAAVRRSAAFTDVHAAAAGSTARRSRPGSAAISASPPTGYLRRVRLEGAHADLPAATPASGLTVQAPARRWGWPNPAQCAAAYRQRFGVPSSRTLRT